MAPIYAHAIELVRQGHSLRDAAKAAGCSLVPLQRQVAAAGIVLARGRGSAKLRAEQKNVAEGLARG